jgi:hypothetical protein
LVVKPALKMKVDYLQRLGVLRKLGCWWRTLELLGYLKQDILALENLGSSWYEVSILVDPLWFLDEQVTDGMVELLERCEACCRVRSLSVIQRPNFTRLCTKQYVRGHEFAVVNHEQLVC